MIDEKKFKMLDEEFICIKCGSKVQKLGYTARDHCPFCLSSIHVDINPGDRKCDCKGTLIPIAIENFKKDKYKIIYKCEKCNAIKKNVTASDDNFDLIIEIMSHPVAY